MKSLMRNVCRRNLPNVKDDFTCVWSQQGSGFRGFDGTRVTVEALAKGLFEMISAVCGQEPAGLVKGVQLAMHNFGLALDALEQALAGMDIAGIGGPEGFGHGLVRGFGPRSLVGG